jgi:hypothetical protein
VPREHFPLAGNRLPIHQLSSLYLVTIVTELSGSYIELHSVVAAVGRGREMDRKKHEGTITADKWL